jgi:starch synthase (maltosyl-transferring)
MIIYNLFPLLAGPFTHWDSHLERAASMGFTHVFVNPMAYPGFSGSLYSIKDYFGYHPLLIDNDSKLTAEQQVLKMMTKAKKLGLVMISDLVINHCAIDSDLIKEHPNWFKWKTKNKVESPWAWDKGKKKYWGDLALFDLNNTSDPQGMREYFLKVTRHLIKLGFRSFRCDAAYQIPHELWVELIGTIKAEHPDVTFLAETLGCTPKQTAATASAGFNFVFNSAKWWDFSSPWLMEQYDIIRQICPTIAFPESHDTERLAKEFKGNIAALRQMYLFTALFSSGVMMTTGYEFGFKRRVNVVRSRPEHWEETGMDLMEFIRDVNKLKASHEVFNIEAETRVIKIENSKIMLMHKHTNTGHAILLLNKDIKNSQSFNIDSIQEQTRSKQGFKQLWPISKEHVSDNFTGEIQAGEGIVLST